MPQLVNPKYRETLKGLGTGEDEKFKIPCRNVGVTFVGVILLSKIHSSIQSTSFKMLVDFVLPLLRQCYWTTKPPTQLSHQLRAPSPNSSHARRFNVRLRWTHCKKRRTQNSRFTGFYYEAICIVLKTDFGRQPLKCPHCQISTREVQPTKPSRCSGALNFH